MVELYGQAPAVDSTMGHSVLNFAERTHELFSTLIHVFIIFAISDNKANLWVDFFIYYNRIYFKDDLIFELCSIMKVLNERGKSGKFKKLKAVSSLENKCLMLNTINIRQDLTVVSQRHGIRIQAKFPLKNIKSWKTAILQAQILSERKDRKRKRRENKRG